MRYLYCLALQIIPLPVMAAFPDECGAERLFKAHADAPASIGEQKCIEIDISQSYDSLGVEVIYHWDLGDGAVDEGMKVNHCYEDFGRHQAKLSVRIPEKEYVSENEMILDIFIKEAVGVYPKIPAETMKDSTAYFEAGLSTLATYDLKEIYWDFGDGSFGCGAAGVNHIYKIPGVYRVRTLVTLTNHDGEVYLLSEKEIAVKSFNVFGSAINSYFTGNTPVPFLDEPVRLVALDQEAKIVRQLEVGEGENYMFTLPPGRKYTLYLWKGNQLAEPQPFNAASLADSLDSAEPVAKLLEKMIASTPGTLQPVFFEYNELEPVSTAKRIIKNNIKLFENLPFARISVGSHTHTEGTREINLAYSERRSENIRREILSQAKGNFTIDIVSPEEDETLINSCFEREDCGKENEALNRRTDFKLTAIGIL